MMVPKHIILLLLLWLEDPTRVAEAEASSDVALIVDSGGEGSSGSADTLPNTRAHHLSRDHFSKILFTALDDDISLQHLYADGNDNNTSRRRLVQEDAWHRMVQHGWEWSRRHHPNNAPKRNRRGRNLRADAASDAQEVSASNSPFVVCSQAPSQSGYRRRRSIVQDLGITSHHTQVLYNTDEESCFIVTTSAEIMQAYHARLIEDQGEGLELATFDTGFTGNATNADSGIAISPLLDVLKLPKGTALNILSNDDWAPLISNVSDLERLSTRTVTNEFSYENDTEVVDVDIREWRETLLVELLPGRVDGVEGRIDEVAEGIVERVKDMAQISPGMRGGTSASSHLRSKVGDSDSPDTVAEIVSVREAFSLTATDATNAGGGGIWSEALSNGFESSHGCQVMLDTLDIRTRVNDQDVGAGFEVILHPPSQFTNAAAVEASAWNKHCALSLLMGLAVHPSVATVEVGVQMEMASFDVDVEGSSIRRLETYYDETSSSDLSWMIDEDEIYRHSQNPRAVEGVTNPQWITQSGIENRRPFFDVGLDGAGEIVAVADGGLEVDNCYFFDSIPSEAIYGEDGWDIEQRKVIHYDDSFADRTEQKSGHGTNVAGILAGKRSVDGTFRSQTSGYADGAAPGSQLAFFDMANGYSSIADPGAARLLRSLYNPDTENGELNVNKSARINNKGARVINASWGRSYNGQYTSYCRLYDRALQYDYPDLTLVVSSGNTGRSGPSSIQDPGSCKNPIAVGSSLSYGSDSRDGELGIEYMADYSSRGPTMDQRIKPDIVAPGHFVLAASARPEHVGECDGDEKPSVKRRATGGIGTKYSTGTSMAAPVVAGSAAILRQYFKEGYCNKQAEELKGAISCYGYEKCGSRIDPSGSLIKAVMMNGAQPLTGGVQFVPSGEVLDRPLKPYDSNQGYGRINMLNSVPLRGENDMQMMLVNDKLITDGQRDSFRLYIDKNNGCNRPLSVTLAWYDPPGAIGCTSCVVNDLDLSVKTRAGTKHPNGRNAIDTANNAERIQMLDRSLTHGEEVRIFVRARNFVNESQKYSLAIGGCFSETPPQPISTTATASTAFSTTRPPLLTTTTAKSTTTTSTATTPKQTSTASTPSASIATKSSLATVPRFKCPTSLLFKLVLFTGNDGGQLKWSLIGSGQSRNDIDWVMSGPTKASDGSKDNTKYFFKTCLAPNKRYRFQLQHRFGKNISAQYKIVYGGRTVSNTQRSTGQLGRVSTVRFKTMDNGKYKMLGSNEFTPHAQIGDVDEIMSNDSEDVGMLSSAHRSDFDENI